MSAVGPISDLYETEDNLLSSYHPEKSDFIDDLLKQSLYLGQNQKNKSVTCSTCFRKFSSLADHECIMIAEDATKKLSPEQKESLTNYQLYGCTRFGCAFRSNDKGEVKLSNLALRPFLSHLG